MTILNLSVSYWTFSSEASPSRGLLDSRKIWGRFARLMLRYTEALLRIGTLLHRSTTGVVELTRNMMASRNNYRGFLNIQGCQTSTRRNYTAARTPLHKACKRCDEGTRTSPSALGL